MTDETTIPDAQPAAPTPRAAWLSLHPKHLRFTKFTVWLFWIALPIIVLGTISAKPLWQWGWQAGIYGYANFLPVNDSAGKRYAGGDWTHGKQIIVYSLPKSETPLPDAQPSFNEPPKTRPEALPTYDYVDPRDVSATADGLRGLIEELNLDIKVTVLPKPPKVALDAWRDALVNSKNGTRFDMDKFEALRLAQRGMKYGEMVIIDTPFKNPDWAWGLTTFRSGLAVLQAGRCGIPLGRHEGAHLLGYDKHDDMPLFIIGYGEGAIPALRDTLMMLNPTSSDALSPRAADALQYFWKGMEDRHQTRYFRQP
jgi:hypothetical protein